MSKLPLAQSHATIMTGIPTRQLGCESSAMPTRVALGDPCYVFWIPLC